MRERRRGFAMAVAEASPGRLFPEARRASPQRRNNGARACDGAGLLWLSASKIPPLCIARKLVSGSPSGQPAAPKPRKRARGRLSQKLWPSPGKLFREARRASPQRQNNATARVCHGCRGSFGRRPESCFEKPDGPAPSAEITERARATARVCHGCRRPRFPRFASLGNLFREARRANPQRQNDGSEREGGCRRSFGRRPENCFGKPDGPAPSAKITERARATARVCHGCRGSFGRRPESCFEKPDGPAPSVKITGASASDAPPARLSRKLRPSPREGSWEARRA